MIEDVNGAIIHEAELTIKCPLPCGAQTIVASDSGGFEFSDLTIAKGCALEIPGEESPSRERESVDSTGRQDR